MLKIKTKITNFIQELRYFLSCLDIARKRQRVMYDYDENQNTIFVSDHAIIRYLERVKKINTDEIAEKMVPPSIRKIVVKTGYREIKTKDCILVVDSGNIITVKPKSKTGGHFPFLSWIIKNKEAVK